MKVVFWLVVEDSGIELFNKCTSPIKLLLPLRLVHTYLHTYLHTNIHTNIQIYTHIHVYEYLYTSIGLELFFNFHCVCCDIETKQQSGVLMRLHVCLLRAIAIISAFLMTCLLKKVYDSTAYSSLCGLYCAAIIVMYWVMNIIIMM